MAENEYPEHVREAAEAIDELRSQRRRQLPARERALQTFLNRIGRPRFVLAVSVFIVVWVTLNMLLASRHEAFDTPAFTLLNTIAQLLSLLLVIAIFSAQNTENTIEQERARLMLQLALIHDRKISAIVQAVEQLSGRSGLPFVQEVPQELHRPTDIHEAAGALQEAERNNPDDESLPNGETR